MHRVSEVGGQTMADDHSTREFDVLCAGLLVADVFGRPIDEVPAWGRLGLVGHIENHVGGCAANTAVDLTIIGGKTAVAGCVGGDGAGLFVKKTLAEKGVDVSGIVESPEASTSYTFIMIGSDGRRRYLHHIGTNAEFTDTHVSDDLLRRARCLHLGGSLLLPGLDGEPAARLLQRAKNLGLTTCIDTAFNPGADCRALMKPCLPHVDVFFPSIEEAEAITGKSDPRQMLDFFDEYNVPVAGVKMGAEGSIVRLAGKTTKYPVFKVSPVDTSGAGDAFMAGLLYALTRGWEVDAAVLFANATSAFCIQAVGCSPGIRSADEIQAFVDQQKADGLVSIDG